MFALGFIEGDFGEVGWRIGEVNGGFGGWVVAPGAYGIEVGEEFRRKLCGERFAVEFLGESVGEVLEHREADEDGIAGCPRCGLVP